MQSTIDLPAPDSFGRSLHDVQRYAPEEYQPSQDLFRKRKAPAGEGEGPQRKKVASEDAFGDRAELLAMKAERDMYRRIALVSEGDLAVVTASRDEFKTGLEDAIEKGKAAVDAMIAERDAAILARQEAERAAAQAQQNERSLTAELNGQSERAYQEEAAIKNLQAEVERLNQQLAETEQNATMRLQQLSRTNDELVQEGQQFENAVASENAKLHQQIQEVENDANMTVQRLLAENERLQRENELANAQPLTESVHVVDMNSPLSKELDITRKNFRDLLLEYQKLEEKLEEADETCKKRVQAEADTWFNMAMEKEERFKKKIRSMNLELEDLHTQVANLNAKQDKKDTDDLSNIFDGVKLTGPSG